MNCCIARSSDAATIRPNKACRFLSQRLPAARIEEHCRQLVRNAPRLDQLPDGIRGQQLALRQAAEPGGNSFLVSWNDLRVWYRQTERSAETTP
jgi:hypothetical protein